MPLLIDGYNVLHASWQCGGPFTDAGRGKFVELLTAWARRRRESVVIVFDGALPRGETFQQPADTPVEVIFSGGNHTADSVIEDRILASSAPRRLLVVSSDHEVRIAARRRRCRTLTSDDFVQTVRRDLARRGRPGEPAQKTEGLENQDVDEWLKTFGLSPADEQGLEVRDDEFLDEQWQ